MFEQWSGSIRSALMWLGLPDPVLSMEAIRKNDPKLQELSAVLGEWHRMLGPERVTAAEVIQAAIKRDPVDLTEFVHPEFREALLAVAGQGGAINSRKLGKWLSANRDRIVEGFVIRQPSEHAGTNVWQVCKQ
jgi:putative DNA primase/helicase